MRSVYNAIHDGNPTADVRAIKYIESLRYLAEGQATKIFLPMEASALLGAIGGAAELLTRPAGITVNTNGSQPPESRAAERPANS